MRITNEMNTQTLSVVDLFGEFNPSWDFYAVQHALEAVEWAKVVACEFAFTTELDQQALRRLFTRCGTVGESMRAENTLLAEAKAAGKTEAETIERLERLQKRVERLQSRAQYNN